MALDLKIGLQEKQIEFLKSIENFAVTLYGGAKGGGKSYALRNLLLARRFEFPNSFGAIFRKTYPELEANHIRPLFAQHPELRQFWSEGKKLLTLSNGSSLQFCHCASEADVDLYQGREFHDLGIDEAGQWSEAAFRKLLGSNRSSKKGIKPRAILTANPGGIGHKWLKRLFIERRYNERERPGDYHFIQALVDDNPALMDNDPDYVARLEAEPNAALRAAYRHGSWDIFAGQFFAEISRPIHFIKQINILRHWNRFGAYDYGFNHPAAFGWFAVNEDGEVFQYRELVQAGLRVDEFCQKIKAFPDTNELIYIHAGWDCWAKKGTIEKGTSPTIAEEFQKHEIVLTKAKIDRIQGASQVRNYLAVREGKPRLYILDNCPITFDCLTRMEHDPNRVEDVLKTDATEGDPMSGDDCFAADTLIATQYGQIPIQRLKIGDLVWTRKGLKPIKDHWLNGLNSKVLKLTISDGRQIVATPNHKFWFKDRFVSLDTLRYGDKLQCLNPKLLYLMKSGSDVILTLPMHIYEIIIGLTRDTACVVWDRCMSKYGKLIMEQFPQGTIFSTPMGIHSTTMWQIWLRSILKLIRLSISKTQRDWQGLGKIWNILELSLANGINPMLVENGTVKMQRIFGQKERQYNHLALSAPSSLIHLVQRELSSVLVLANKSITAKPQHPSLMKSVEYARVDINPSNTDLHSPVAVYVEEVLEFGKTDTYSLHIADCHEYYANGVLVSNSYDMLRYALMSRPLISDTPKINPKPGTNEYSDYVAKELEQNILDKIKKSNDNRDGQGMNWVVGDDMVPDWNKWD